MFHLLLFGHVADVDRPLVELSHHEDRGDRLLLGVGNDGHLLGPLLKVLHTETDRYSLKSRVIHWSSTQKKDSAYLHPQGDVVHLEGGVRVIQVHLQAGGLARDGRQDGGVV